MKRLLAVFVALAVCGGATILGMTVMTSASASSVSGDYDISPDQASTYLGAATRKLGWTVGASPQSYSAPILPWSMATISVRVTLIRQSQSHIELSGNTTKIGELKREIDQRLPAATP